MCSLEDLGGGGGSAMLGDACAPLQGNLESCDVFILEVLRVVGG